MSIFKSEKEMQLWIEENLSDKEIWGLSELIINIDEIEDYAPCNTPERKIKESFTKSLTSMHLLEIVTANENISNTKDEVLKPDIIAYCPERETLVIIELKNFAGATREAGTEISAYAAELKSSLFNLSDGDIVNVIISPHWPTLIKHHIYNTIVWQHKNILCLEPCIFNGEIKLKITDIKNLVQAITPEKFSDQQLSGFTVCLYDDTQQQENPPPTELHNHIQLMLSSMDVIASKGEKINSHGSAFLSREEYGFGLSPYFISVINVAPFKCLERMLHLDEIRSYSDLPVAMKKYFDIYMEHTPDGYGECLLSISTSANEILKTVCTPRIEGFTTWDEIERQLNTVWKPLYFASWGLFKDLSVEILSKEYKNGNFYLNLNSVELGFKVVEQSIDKNHLYYNLLHLPDEFFPDKII